MKMPRSVPSGRLGDLLGREDAERIAYVVPVGLFAEYTVKRFASRKALEVFCRHGSKMHALVKTPVRPSMLVNRNIQTEVRS